ncbi:MAG: hypothetical protein AAF429_13365 [Pseudomonadota bacterium]
MAGQRAVCCIASGPADAMRIYPQHGKPTPDRKAVKSMLTQAEQLAPSDIALGRLLEPETTIALADRLESEETPAVLTISALCALAKDIAIWNMTRSAFTKKYEAGHFHIDAFVDLIRAGVDLMQLDATIDLFHHIAPDFEARLTSRHSEEVAFDAGFHLFTRAGQPEQAIEWLARAVAAKKTAERLSPLAHLYHQQGRAEDCLSSLRSLERIRGLSAMELGLRGLSFVKTGQIEAAEAIQAELSGRDQKNAQKHAERIAKAISDPQN